MRRFRIRLWKALFWGMFLVLACLGGVVGFACWYVTDSENMADLFEAITALKALPWFAASVRDIRAFRIEQWSDFTPVIKKP